MRKFFASAVILACTLMAAMQPGFAEQLTFKQATADYQAGHYQKALIAFERFREANPNNVLVHYYEALCYQGLNALDKAREEFNFVVQNDAGDLRRKSEAGLKRLQGAKTETSGISGSRARENGPPKLIGQEPPREGHLYNIVMYVDMNRCKKCAAFGEAWSQIEKERPGQAMTRIDIETGDPSLITYRVYKRHPFLVLLDGVGKPLWSGMAPLKTKEIEDLIDRYKKVRY